jgi:hypothetical protein
MLAVGCGDSKTAQAGKIVPVAGYVKLKDVPLPIGTITFHPDAAKGNKSTEMCTSPIAADGSYKLLTGGKDGAPVGWYKVTIAPTGMPKEMPTAGQPLPKAPAFDSKYQKPEMSGLVVEVVENAPVGAYDFNLK